MDEDLNPGEPVEVDVLDPIVDPESPADTEPELVPVADFTLMQAMVGDVLMVPLEQELPADWHVCDGSTQDSYRWPEFVEQLGIAGATFTIPAPERVLPGYCYIIKLGEARLKVASLLPPPLPEPAPGAEVQEKIERGVRDEAPILVRNESTKVDLTERFPSNG